jgi:hypothetical protein
MLLRREIKSVPRDEFREVPPAREAQGAEGAQHPLNWMLTDKAGDAARATEQRLTPTENSFLDVFSQPVTELAAKLKKAFPGLSDNETRDIARSLGDDPVALARSAAALIEGREPDPEGLAIVNAMNSEAKHAFGHFLYTVKRPEIEG